MYTVYIIQCADDSLYTGITNNLPRRWALHQAGKASKYTRSHPVKKIIYTKQCRTKSTALKRELAIKKLSRIAKLELIAKQGILQHIIT